MSGFLESPTHLKPRQPENRARQVESSGTVVRYVEFFGAEDLDAVSDFFARFAGVEFLPRYVVEDIPTPLVLSGLEKFEISPICLLAHRWWHGLARVWIEGGRLNKFAGILNRRFRRTSKPRFISSVRGGDVSGTKQNNSD